MTQTPYQPGISYLPKYGDRYMNTNDFAPAQGSPSSAKAGAVTTTAQLIPGQQGTVPYTGAPPAADASASTVTMADPFANNPQFQSIMDRTPTPSFGIQPMIGFRQNINYDPGADNNIPPFTPTNPDTGGSTGGGSYVVSDNSDDETGPGFTSYDDGNTWYSNQDGTPTYDTVYDIDTTYYDYDSDDLGNAPTSTVNDNSNDYDSGGYHDYDYNYNSDSNSDTGTGYDAPTSTVDDNKNDYDEGGYHDYDTPSTDNSTYNDKDGLTYTTPDTTSDNESSSGGGCFITTAIVNRRGEANDGETLTKLRAFRDTFMGGKESDDLKEYYAIAPAIIKAIPEDHSDWNWIEKQIDLAIEKIDDNQLHDAYNIYKAMVLKLKEEWL